MSASHKRVGPATGQRRDYAELHDQNICAPKDRTANLILLSRDHYSVAAWMTLRLIGRVLRQDGKDDEAFQVSILADLAEINRHASQGSAVLAVSEKVTQPMRHVHHLITADLGSIPIEFDDEDPIQVASGGYCSRGDIAETLPVGSISYSGYAITDRAGCWCCDQ